MLLYKLFLFTYPKVAKWLGLFNQKAKQWTIGQNRVWAEIQEKQKQLSGFEIIWFHAASFGEFEQGLPIIEALKLKHPQYKIWVTFFSPSGYLYRKNDPSVDAVTYLPFDSPENAVSFLNSVNPKLIVFIKYEFWFYYLTEARNRQIPIILASAIFRPTQIFFKWYGGFYKKMLSLFSSILVQDEEMYELVAPVIKKTRLFISGDTRFDRVFQTSKELNSINWMQLMSSHKNFIAGSTWKEDELILFKTTAHFTQFNWIIVPHHVDEKSIASTRKIFTNAITLTELLQTGIKYTKPIILIVDQIGLLRTLYQYAYISYVGGGFGKDGVHNVLEPAAFGIPVIWGHNDIKYKEAIRLRKNNGGFHIKNEAELVMHLNELLNTAGCYEQVSNNAINYIINHTGATQKTMKEIDIQLNKA